MSTYDEIYTQSWNDVLKECEKTLERHDYERVLGVKSIRDFRTELTSLTTKYQDQQSAKAITLIQPTLDHYETFAQNFVSMMAQPVDTSMMWGLFVLVFRLALDSTDPVNPNIINPLSRITRWLEKIGHKLEVSNDCRESITDITKVKGDTVEVSREIVVLWLNIIMTFRNGGYGREVSLDESAWDSLTSMYNKAYHNIEEAVKRIERVAEMAGKHARVIYDMTMMQHLLSLQESQQGGATLPCNNLPVAENRRFFGRQDILLQLEEHLRPATNSPFSSVALHGLGGIGKTQIALAYAYQRVADLDAVFWIAAQDSFSIQQGFSRVAVDALKLPAAHPQSHQENMLLVLSWMHTTFATLPIDIGLEVNEFGVDDGADFLLHMAPNRQRADSELDAARQVTNLLGGLPLALNQMAALINAWSCSIAEFHAIYLKYERRLHKQTKSGWKYLGYQHSLDTVFEMSFANLGNEARTCLGVLSFLSADSVPAEVFKSTEPGGLPELLSFCKEELSLGDAMEELTHHSLVRKNIAQGTFRIHRLVQAEYRARMDYQQEQFEVTTKLLLGKLPHERANKYDDEEWALYERYIPQVLALAKNYNDSQAKPDALRANMDFVNLLVNAANGIHDNDKTNSVVGFLDTADFAYQEYPEAERDRLTWAHLQSLKCMYHFCTSEFVRSEREMTEGLDIRLDMLPPEYLLLALSYSWLGMAVGAQERYKESLNLLLEAGKVLEGPAGEIPTRKMVWSFNTSRNYYCMGKFEEAEALLSEAMAAAVKLGGWYQLVYAHLTFASLRTRMGRLNDAHDHVDTAKKILETSGLSARFSWLSSYCAYRAGDVAMKQGRVQDAIEETERAATIGKLVKVPIGILCRCIHAYSKALALDPQREEESEYQRQEARRVRSLIPGDSGDLDDESDEAFERLVKMDHR